MSKCIHGGVHDTPREAAMCNVVMRLAEAIATRKEVRTDHIFRALMLRFALCDLPIEVVLSGTITDLLCNHTDLVESLIQQFSDDCAGPIKPKPEVPGA
jgi:hypothetical protein